MSLGMKNVSERKIKMRAKNKFLVFVVKAVVTFLKW
jgi:hypothetical protein